jgi:hypothetical protein
MSVIMIMRVTADPAAFEQYARANSDQIARITDAAKAAGALRHEFVAGDGEVLAIDEWPDEASFHRFFAGATEIPAFMEGAGAQGQPQVTFHRKLDMADEF